MGKSKNARKRIKALENRRNSDTFSPEMFPMALKVARKTIGFNLTPTGPMKAPNAIIQETDSITAKPKRRSKKYKRKYGKRRIENKGL